MNNEPPDNTDTHSEGYLHKYKTSLSIMATYSCSNPFMARKHNYLCLTVLLLGVAFYSVVSNNIRSQKLQILWDSLLSVIQIFSITNGHRGVFQISPTRDVDQLVSVRPG